MSQEPQDIGHLGCVMSRRFQILAITILLGSVCAAAQAYAGPHTLGPFRIDQNVSMASLFARLGMPASTKAETFCYRSADGDAFLALTRLDPVYDDPKSAGAVVLSKARNCVKQRVLTATTDFAHWKAEKGIGLLSTEGDVTKAYGSPSTELTPKSADCGLSVYGADVPQASSGEESDSSCKVMVYKGPPEDLNTAEFGIKSGKVVWIMLSQNE